MRVVLDTNQHISATIRPDGHPAQIVKLWRIGLIELAISPPILEEFKIVVHRPRIQQKYNLSDSDRDSNCQSSRFSQQLCSASLI